MPINLRPFGGASPLLGQPWAAPESWQWQPDTTVHDPASVLTLEHALISTSIAGTVAEATADALIAAVPFPAANIDAAVAEAQAHAQIEWVQPQQSVAPAGEVASATATAPLPTVTTFGPSVSVSGARAEAQAEALPPDPSTNNVAILGAIAEVIAAALEATLATQLQPSVIGEIAAAVADVRAPNVLSVEPEPAIGSGSTPAGLNLGACAVDFAIDGVVLNAQPFAILREGPKHEIRSSPRGYALPSLREGRVWRFQWGETLVDTATVAELRSALGTQLRHRWSWTEPDGTPIDLVGSLLEIEYQWSQASPGFYEPVAFRVLEHER